MDENVIRADSAWRYASNRELAQAIQKAVRLAVLDHKQAGNPVAAWQDRRVVLVPPEQIVVPEGPMEDAADADLSINPESPG